MRNTKKTMKRMIAGFLVVAMLPAGATGKLKLKEEVKADVSENHGAVISMEYTPAKGYVELTKNHIIGPWHNLEQEWFWDYEISEGCYRETLEYDFFNFSRENSQSIEECIPSRGDKITYHFEDGTDLNFWYNPEVRTGDYDSYDSTIPYGWYTVLSDGTYEDRFSYFYEHLPNYYVFNLDFSVRKTREILDDENYQREYVDLQLGEELVLIVSQAISENGNYYVLDTTTSAKIVKDIVSITPESDEPIEITEETSARLKEFENGSYYIYDWIPYVIDSSRKFKVSFDDGTEKIYTLRFDQNRIYEWGFVDDDGNVLDNVEFYCDYYDRYEKYITNGIEIVDTQESVPWMGNNVFSTKIVVHNLLHQESNYEIPLEFTLGENIARNSEEMFVKTEINGYQISNTAKGFRTAYSVSDAYGFVEKAGLIYSVADMATEEDMVISSENQNVYSYVATDEGKLSSSVSGMNDASSYVMTMKFKGVSDEFYSAKLMLRAYAQLEDGTYVYSDVKTVSVYDVADVLYQNRKMNNLVGHNYLYDEILSVVNNEYKKVDYDWSEYFVNL